MDGLPVIKIKNSALRKNLGASVLAPRCCRLERIASLYNGPTRALDDYRFSESRNLLAGAARIDVGCIEKVDAQFERLFDKGSTLFFIECPGVRAFFRGYRRLYTPSRGETP
jgi:hypothetical protein